MQRASRRIVTILLLLGLLNPGLSPAQLGALSFGLTLNQLLVKVGTLTTAAQNAGNPVVVAAGGQIQAAILMAKIGYQDSLNSTADRFTQAQRNLLDDLSTKVGYLEKAALKELREIASQGAVAVNVLPFSKTSPQLGAYLPPYLMPSTSTLVTMKGNFFDVARAGYAPTLALGNEQLSPVASTPLELGFSIPAPKTPAPDNSLTYRSGKLIVPHQGKCLSFFNCRAEARFDVLLIALPSTAGKLEFRASAPKSSTDSAPKESALIRQESSKNDIPKPRAHGFQHCVQPDPGWYVDTRSVAISIKHREGDWQNNGNTSSLAAACWNITTVHHNVGPSGKVHFTIKFTQMKEGTKIESLPTQTAQIGWGSTKTFNVPASGSWKAIYTQFDGKRIDIDSAVFDNPYLTIQTSGNTVSFKTFP
jgi:hypothetical protein